MPCMSDTFLQRTFPIGIFFLAFSSLAFTALSIRAASVAFGSDFLFFILPLTFLGIGVGGALAYFSPTRSERLLTHVAFLYVMLAACLFVAVAHAQTSLGGVLSMIVFFSLSASVHALSSWIIATLLRVRSRDVAYLYFFDLVGASLGAASAVFLLENLRYDEAVYTALFLGALPVALFLAQTRTPRTILALSLLVLMFPLGLPNSSFLFSIPCADGKPSLHRATNYFSHVDVRGPMDLHTQQEMGRLASGKSPEGSAHLISVDCGLFVTPITPIEDQSDTSFLQPSLRSIPFSFGQGRFGNDFTSLIPNAGGGIDILRARLFTQGKIDAVELNPNIVDAAKRFSNPVAYPYGQPRVHLYIEDSRRFIETSTSTYDVILIAKAAHYGAVPADAQTPDYSATIEATATYLAHLSPKGLIAHTRPAGRGVEHMALSFVEAGLDPTGKIAFIRGIDGREDMVLAQRENFSEDDMLKIKRVSEERGFSVEFPTDSQIKEQMSLARSPTDQRPYTARPEAAFPVGEAARVILLLAFGVAAVASCFAIVTVRSHADRSRLTLAPILLLTIFFALIGFGFTFMQLGLLQKVLFLMAEPSSAVAITLSSFLLFSGLGSLTTHYMPRNRHLLLINIATIVLSALLLAALVYGDTMLLTVIRYDLIARTVVSFAFNALPAFALGMFLPIALKTLGDVHARLIPWAWAVDGVFGVIGGISAKGLFQLYGPDSMYPVVSLAYIVAALAFWLFYRSRVS